MSRRRSVGTFNTSKDLSQVAVKRMNGSDPLSRGQWSAASVHPDLLLVKAAVYAPAGFDCSLPVLDADSADYGGASFSMNGRQICSRAGKLTPTKNGLFVTVWMRAADGQTRPLGPEDALDTLAVTAREGSHFGQFIFPAGVLRHQGIVSADQRGGKRGFRIYPPWVGTTSQQAFKTQAWQTEFFLPLDGTQIDLERAKALYGS
jgi:hypothetical protein